jgi:hypothetical protein
MTSEWRARELLQRKKQPRKNLRSTDSKRTGRTRTLRKREEPEFSSRKTQSTETF